MASNFIIAQIRTWVPIAVGAVIGWLLSQGILDPDTAAAAENAFVVGITALTQGVYYFLVRLLAEKWGWIGYLLGYNKAPDYQTPASDRSDPEFGATGAMSIQSVLVVAILVVLLVFLITRVS